QEPATPNSQPTTKNPAIPNSKPAIREPALPNPQSPPLVGASARLGRRAREKISRGRSEPFPAAPQRLRSDQVSQWLRLPALFPAAVTPGQQAGIAIQPPRGVHAPLRRDSPPC